MRPFIRLWLASLYLFIMGTVSLAYTLVELLLGIMYHSLLVTSDALHGFLDAAIAYISGFGLYYASRRGRSFPWEIYRVESLLTLLSTLAILGFYTYMLATSIELNGEPTPMWMTLLLLAGGGITFLLYLWERHNYESLKLDILKADALHAKVDTVLSAVAALAVVVSNLFHLVLAEVVAVFIIYLYVLYEFSKLAKEATYGIVGALYRDDSLEEKIRNILAELGRPIDVKIRRLGSFFVVYSLVGVTPDMTIGKLHALRTKAIKTISRLHPLIVHVDIKIVPRRKEYKRGERSRRA
ncbi:cation diffusion facilitator family transporter [Pyrobaculum aerophilum]|uniref:Cation efflux system protein, conjectural n=2 Tax=Pyrobaculum aerophilum TaxID=13773 RepID=Q8ZVI6_PYRAE|nr:MULTISPECIES: cation diffusion facilitator family transporter [Pyrobaculum]AAL64070.1 cation efflux system protein, conjectural [Pyrobaculum aerophilum str. IM2]MCX8135816.1 cation diffusion facilitator family transporter [Pyrobaculum aerophilum]HII47166.1 cation transporter [Pyrobaculum aerophilum]